MQYRDGIGITDDGALLITTDAVTPAAQYRNGVAITNNAMHTIDATAGVPAGALYRRGLARSVNGAVYTTTAAPTSASKYSDGRAINAAGALHISSSIPTTGQFSAGVFLSALGAVYVSGGDPPTTITKTVAEMSDALTGFFNKSGSHSGTASWDWRSDDSSLTFYAKGTDCAVNIYQAAGGGFWYSVDDGAWVQTGSTTGFYDLSVFAGLPNTEHLVRFVSDVGFNGGFAATRASGNLISLTGVNPTIRAIGASYHVTDPALPGQWAGLTSAAIGSGYTPNIRQAVYSAGDIDNGWGFNTGVGVLAGRGTELWGFTSAPRGRYGLDDTDWIDVTFPAGLGARRCWRRFASGLDASIDHEYCMTECRLSSLDGSTGKPIQMMALGPLATATYGSATTREIWVQPGDSTTQLMNEAGQHSGHGDLCIAAQRLGAIGLHVGLAGANVASLKAALPNILGHIAFVPSGWVIAIGANDAFTAQATFIADYQNVMQQCRDFAASSKILGRTIVPDNTGLQDSTTSTYIETAVATFLGGGTVASINARPIRPVNTLDGQHPTTETGSLPYGVEYMAAQLQPLYDPYFA